MSMIGYIFSHVDDSLSESESENIMTISIRVLYYYPLLRQSIPAISNIRKPPRGTINATC